MNDPTASICGVIVRAKTDLAEATHADLNPVLYLADIVCPAVGAGDGQERDSNLISDFDLGKSDSVSFSLEQLIKYRVYHIVFDSYVDNGQIARVNTGGSSTMCNIIPLLGVRKDDCGIFRELRREQFLDLRQLDFCSAVVRRYGVHSKAEEASSQDAQGPHLLKVGS